MEVEEISTNRLLILLHDESTSEVRSLEIQDELDSRQVPEWFRIRIPSEDDFDSWWLDVENYRKVENKFGKQAEKICNEIDPECKVLNLYTDTLEKLTREAFKKAEGN